MMPGRQRRDARPVEIRDHRQRRRQGDDPVARAGRSHDAGHVIVQPPSTISTCPTTCRDKSLERNSTAPTRSSG